MKKVLLTISASSLVLTACGQPQMMMPAMRGPVNMMQAANAPMQSQLTTPRLKEETPLIPDRNVNVPRSPFDTIADGSKNKQYPQDPTYVNPQQPRGDVRNPFDSPFGSLPFSTWSDFRDHVKYGYSTTHEDAKYMNEYYAKNHFNRYINSSFRQVQELYKPTRDEMKRFITLDVLANSLEVNGTQLPYEDIHNPPAERHYKMFPTEAANFMPSFGEIVSYNRNSYDVNYVRWDNYRAARYYQANYRRIFGLVMEHGPTKKDAWRMVHREISAYASN